MKVIYRNSENIEITGEFISRLDRIASFVPDKEAYGKDRITMCDATIAIAPSREDDSCIMVSGYVRADENKYTKDLVIFFPLK